jgi:hypothetical protein
MITTLTAEPALSPQRAARTPAITANLLPEEVVAARRARRTRAWVVGVLLLVLVLLGGWYALTWKARSDAQGELDAVRGEAAALQAQQRRFGAVVAVEQQNGVLTQRLSGLLADDVGWSALYETLRATGASAAVTITGINGSLAAAGAGVPAAAATGLPSTAGKAVGTLVVTGTAPDKPSLARFVDALGGLGVVANPYLTSAAQVEGKNEMDFSLLLDVTGKARCGRYNPTTPTCTATGGK